MKPAIEVKNLSKSYIISHQKEGKQPSGLRNVLNMVQKPLGGGGPGYTKETFWALKDVSFEVRPGEIFGILGRNGSGKSTLLKILSRIVDPTQGEAILHGKTSSLLEVGTGFHPELTGRENVFLNGSMLGLSRQEIIRKFDEIVEFSEVEKFIDTPVKFYSSGMYVRLAFSVAAHLEPDILILDEVLAVGDAAFQKKSLNKILATMEEGRTVLFVSHSMSAVQQLCSRGILLKDGHVDFEGPVGELTERYMAMMSGGGEVDKPTTIWENDGKTANDYFIPRAMYLADSQGRHVSGPIKNDEPHYITIEAEVTKESDLLTIGYGVHNEASTLMYMTHFTDTGKAKPLPMGQIIMRGEIPPHLLNAGIYKVALQGGIHNKYWLFEPGTHVPSIEIRIHGGLSESPFWQQPREGLMAPIVKWEVKKA